MAGVVTAPAATPWWGAYWWQAPIPAWADAPPHCRPFHHGSQMLPLLPGVIPARSLQSGLYLPPVLLHQVHLSPVWLQSQFPPHTGELVLLFTGILQARNLYIKSSVIPLLGPPLLCLSLISGPLGHLCSSEGENISFQFLRLVVWGWNSDYLYGCSHYLSGAIRDTPSGRDPSTFGQCSMYLKNLDIITYKKALVTFMVSLLLSY